MSATKSYVIRAAQANEKQLAAECLAGLVRHQNNDFAATKADIDRRWWYHRTASPGVHTIWNILDLFDGTDVR